MNKNTILIILVVAIISYLFFTCSKKNQSIDDNSYIINILEQKNKKRLYWDDSLNLLIKIDFENKIYIPGFCKVDEAGNIYIFDRSTGYIHKFSEIKNNNYFHTFFGKGKGQGPGELSDPKDFNIYKNKIYIVDPANGCIEVYSTEGINLERIKLNNHLTPGKIIILNNKLLVEPYTYAGKDLFYLYDDLGNLISSFGKYIDNTNIYNGVYHDNDILKISENCFYYLPRYLGFVGFYKDDSLIFAKTTIDGLKKPEAMTNKKVMKGVYISKIKKSFYTAASSACNSQYLIIQAFDVKEQKEFYDLYTIESFQYLKTINNIPYLLYFDMNDELFTGVDDTCMYVWSVKNL